jgi:hypothetical protein
MGGTLAVAHGGTGITSLTASRFVSTSGASAVETVKAIPAGVVVGTTDSQTLTNKTVSDTTNDVMANSMRCVDTFGGSQNVVTNVAIGPAPKSRYSFLSALKARDGTLYTAQAAWGSLYETRPTWFVEQTLANTGATTALTWVNRIFNRVVIDSALNFDPGVGNPTSTPWSCYNFVTLTNGGTTNARIDFTPGIYEIDCSSDGVRCGNFYTSLYNYTTSAFMTNPNDGNVICGSLGFAATTAQADFAHCPSIIHCFITIPVNSSIGVQQYCKNSNATGQGYVFTPGDAATFANAVIARCTIWLVKSLQTLT